MHGQESTETPTGRPAGAAAGRPSDPSIGERILIATRELLVEVGWQGTSIRSIAQRAGVSRAALHRRWQSKTHVVLAAVLGETPDLTPVNVLDRETWVRGVVGASLELFHRPEVRAAVPGILATLRDHDDIRAAIWRDFTAEPARLFPTGAGDGAADARRGQLDARAAIVVAAGAALFLSLVAGEDDTPALHRRLEEILLRYLTDSEPTESEPTESEPTHKGKDG